jgi:Leucine-rich repeat (LRR) protein
LLLLGRKKFTKDLLSSQRKVSKQNRFNFSRRLNNSFLQKDNMFVSSLQRLFTAAIFCVLCAANPTPVTPRNPLCSKNTTLFQVQYSAAYIQQKFTEENMTLIPCPNDTSSLIQVLRFQQETKFLPVNISQTFQNLLGIFAANKNLQKIDGKSFENLASMEIIQLNDNKISHIPDDTFKHLQNLRILVLRTNNIVWIDFDIFKHNKKLKWVAVDVNLVLDWNKKSLSNALSKFKNTQQTKKCQTESDLEEEESFFSIQNIIIAVLSLLFIISIIALAILFTRD